VWTNVKTVGHGVHGGGKVSNKVLSSGNREFGADYFSKMGAKGVGNVGSEAFSWISVARCIAIKFLLSSLRFPNIFTDPVLSFPYLLPTYNFIMLSPIFEILILCMFYQTLLGRYYWSLLKEF